MPPPWPPSHAVAACSGAVASAGVAGADADATVIEQGAALAPAATRGRARGDNLACAIFNAGAKAPWSHMGDDREDFRLKLQQAVATMCHACHIVGLEELNKLHAAWLETSLPPGWLMASDRALSLHLLWDDRELSLLNLTAKKVFPLAGPNDEHRHWREFVEAGQLPHCPNGSPCASP